MSSTARRKTYRYMMFVGLLVAITDKSLHPRCLQLQSGCDGAYDPRSLCKDVVSPFEKKMLKGRLGGSCDPFVNNPARHPMIEKTNKVKSAADKVVLGKLWDVLEFVRTADDAMRKKMFCYAYGLVLKRPPTESSLVEFDVSEDSDVSADKFFDFLEAHTQGVSAVVTLAAYFRTCCGKVKSAVVHPITESGASPKEVGDIDLTLKDGCPVAVEVKDKPYKDVDVQHACEKALKAGVHHVVFAFGPEAEKKRPRYFVMENVAALGRLAKFAAVRKRLLDGYRRMGYHVRFEVLDSQYYSTPQRRERLIMIGTTDEIETFPFPAPSQKLITARDVLSNFDEPGTGNNKGVCEARITLAKRPVLRVSAYAGMLFNGMGRPIDLSRPCQTLPASMGGNKTPIIDTRLLKDDSAPDWLKSIHIKMIKVADMSKTKVPKFMRRITVSEAAALQGFPKGFEFCGSQCDKYKQIGNSVPPPFAYAIAREVRSSWNEKSCRI